MSKELWGWERCNHKGIGLPGCRTCDPRKSEVANRYEWVIENHRARLARTEAELAETRRERDEWAGAASHLGALLANDHNEWATGLCSAHQKPDPLCRVCNPALATTQDELAETRRELKRRETEASPAVKLLRTSNERDTAVKELAETRAALAALTKVKP